METVLTALFVDCDSYFASVEQHLDPKLRGRPVAVCPVRAESTCCIAASYEAKAFGVKTGTPVYEARKLCPGIVIVDAKPPEYVRFHHRVKDAVESCIHVEAVLSIDEMWAWLPYNWRDPETVENLARMIKTTIAREVSPFIKVSIGAGPNRWLAKVASIMRKPDGFFLIHPSKLPGVLHELELRDLHGIGKHMALRLNAAGITSVAELCAASKNTLHHVWGGVCGDRIWYLLRGGEIPEEAATPRRSISHSHVLPPQDRKQERAWPILSKMLHKGCARLRSYGLLTGSLIVQVRFVDKTEWGLESPVPETDSTLKLTNLLNQMWRQIPNPGKPLLKVGIILARLCERDNFTPQLPGFSAGPVEAVDEVEKLRRLDEAIDRLRSRFGRQVVFFGGVHEARDAAPMRIAFNHIPDLGIESDR